MRRRHGRRGGHWGQQGRGPPEEVDCSLEVLVETRALSRAPPRRSLRSRILPREAAVKTRCSAHVLRGREVALDLHGQFCQARLHSRGSDGAATCCREHPIFPGLDGSAIFLGRLYCGGQKSEYQIIYSYQSKKKKTNTYFNSSKCLY